MSPEEFVLVLESKVRRLESALSASQASEAELKKQWFDDVADRNGMIGTLQRIISDASVREAELREKLAEEQESHAQLQSRCYDQGGTFSNVFDDRMEWKQRAESAEAKLKEISEAPVVAVVLEDLEIAGTSASEMLLHAGDELIIRPTIKEE